MGASFRNIGEIQHLAGCDRLTIAPSLLAELHANTNELPRILGPDASESAKIPEKFHLDEKTFRWMLNEDAMATEKLAEGIRLFTVDLLKLEDVIKQKLT